MLREFQGKRRLNYNCQLGTLALENIHHAELLFCPWIINRWMIFFFSLWFKWWKAQNLWILVSKCVLPALLTRCLQPKVTLMDLFSQWNWWKRWKGEENASFWAAPFTKHFSYLKIFKSKKSETAILQHKGDQEKCRALMAGSAGRKIHPIILESSALEPWRGKGEMQLSWTMSSRENSFLA